MSNRKYREIGQKLQDARIKKGWSLDEVQLKLQISKRYLMALEAGETDDLPGDYYIQSLVKQYSNLLGISVNHDTIKKEPNSIKEWRRDHQKVTSRSQRDARQRKSVLIGLINQHPWLMGNIFIIVVWLLVWGASSDIAHRSKTNFEVPRQVRVTDETKKVPVSKKKAKAKAKAKKQSSFKLEPVAGKIDTFKVTLGKNQKSVDLQMKVNQANSWGQLQQTLPVNKALWQGNLQAKQIQKATLAKGSTYVIRVGNAKDFEAKLNDKAIPLTQNGQILRTITIFVS